MGDTCKGSLVHDVLVLTKCPAPLCLSNPGLDFHLLVLMTNVPVSKKP